MLHIRVGIAVATFGIGLTLGAAAEAPEVAPGKIRGPLRERLRESAGPVVAWVFFADKPLADRVNALRTLETAYHPRAIARRRLRRTAPGLVDERDLPVADAYLRQLGSTGAAIRVTSRWLNAASVLAGADELRRMAALPCVDSLQVVRPLRNPQRPGAGGPPAGGHGGPAGGFYGESHAQLEQIDLVALHLAGFTGEGVVVGVLDTGFKRTHAAFNHPDHPLHVLTEFDFLNGDVETGPEEGDLPNQHRHGTLILGTLGAYAPGLLVGGAYDASFILAKVEDTGSEYTAEEDLFVAGLEFIEANGGDVATSSLTIFDHYRQDQLDGETAVMTIGLNVATENGLHCFQGAGNEGHDFDPATAHLVPAADALLTVTVGAVAASGVMAGFSSDGPTADGRIKPEVLARGLDTRTTDPQDDQGIASASGTSLSTPLAAAAAACLVQAHPDWTVSQLRSALFQTSAYHVTNGFPDPLFVRGFGIVNAHAAAGTTPSIADLDGDFHVGITDLVRLLLAWGPCPGCAEDLDGDGSVSITDLVRLLLEWG